MASLPQSKDHPFLLPEQNSREFTNNQSVTAQDTKNREKWPEQFFSCGVFRNVFLNVRSVEVRLVKRVADFARKSRSALRIGVRLVKRVDDFARKSRFALRIGVRLVKRLDDFARKSRFALRIGV